MGLRHAVYALKRLVNIFEPQTPNKNLLYNTNNKIKKYDLTTFRNRRTLYIEHGKGNPLLKGTLNKIAVYSFKMEDATTVSPKAII